MFTNEIEEFLNSEMEEVKGGTGAQHTCVCEHGGAGAIYSYSFARTTCKGEIGLVPKVKIPHYGFYS